MIRKKRRVGHKSNKRESRVGKKNLHKISGYLARDTTRLTLFRGCRQGGFKLAHQGRQPVAYRLVERVAVPARGFADCARAASDPARPALWTGPRGARSTA